MIAESERQYNLAIVGGGMAGVTAALCYAQLGLSVALIEAVEPELDTSPSFDQRAIALSASSVAIYQTLGLWPALQPFASPIRHIHVSDRGHYGFTRLHASDYQVDALGQVVPLELAGPALWREVDAQPLITAFCPAQVNACQQNPDHCQLTLQDQSAEIIGDINAQLVLAADGTFSALAVQNDLPVQREPYHQHAVIANIQTEQAHQFRAFERFTASGPLALLPLTQNRLSLVWCQRPETVEQVMGYSDTAFCQHLQRAFGYRLGRIEKVGQRAQYPLSLHLAEKHYQRRVLLMGNAAHTLHPIAGQGFNLGLRDIAALNDLLRDAISCGEDIGGESLLAGFVAARQADWQQTVLATDALTRIFSNDFFPAVIARTKGMNLLNMIPLAKRQLAYAAMGYNLRSSRLARGLKNEPLVPTPPTQEPLHG